MWKLLQTLTCIIDFHAGVQTGQNQALHYIYREQHLIQTSQRTCCSIRPKPTTHLNRPHSVNWRKRRDFFQVSAFINMKSQMLDKTRAFPCAAQTLCLFTQNSQAGSCIATTIPGTKQQKGTSRDAARTLRPSTWQGGNVTSSQKRRHTGLPGNSGACLGEELVIPAPRWLLQLTLSKEAPGQRLANGLLQHPFSHHWICCWN
ncbi:uncharacterized protein LOC128340271 [Hemicordylus capensis]|uniref:uncharacterized protein LOC128340271 n=1 Tax=Hemicordylus capensis TaxID=884348 RepID=UPI002302957C|nr:uncharacterized protein LOC128340271 [Hemicordylus capensis]